MKKKEPLFPYIILFIIIPLFFGLLSFIDKEHLPTFWAGFKMGIGIDFIYIGVVGVFKVYTKFIL